MDHEKVNKVANTMLVKLLRAGDSKAARILCAGNPGTCLGAVAAALRAPTTEIDAAFDGESESARNALAHQD